MILALAAALLQPPGQPEPSPPPAPSVPKVPYWPFKPDRPPEPPAPPPGPARDILVETSYVLECRVAAEDGAGFDLKATTTGRGTARTMVVASGAPDRFPSGTASASTARTRNWVEDDYVEVFTINRRDGTHTVTLGWRAGRLTDVALTSLRPAAAQPFGSPGTATCRRL